MVGFVLADREIQMGPVAARLIRLDAASADPRSTNRPLTASALSRTISASSRIRPCRATSKLYGSVCSDSDEACDDSPVRVRADDQPQHVLHVPAAVDQLGGQRSRSTPDVRATSLAPPDHRAARSSPRPNASFHSRFTNTRATSGLSRTTIHLRQIQPRGPPSFDGERLQETRARRAPPLRPIRSANCRAAARGHARLAGHRHQRSQHAVVDFFALLSRALASARARDSIAARCRDDISRCAFVRRRCVRPAALATIGAMSAGTSASITRK